MGTLPPPWPSRDSRWVIGAALCCLPSADSATRQLGQITCRGFQPLLTMHACMSGLLSLGVKIASVCSSSWETSEGRAHIAYSACLIGSFARHRNLCLPLPVSSVLCPELLGPPRKISSFLSSLHLYICPDSDLLAQTKHEVWGRKVGLSRAGPDFFQVKVHTGNTVACSQGKPSPRAALHSSILYKALACTCTGERMSHT